MLYAVVLFYQAHEIGDESLLPYEWVYCGTHIYNNPRDQIISYANTPCPASQTVEAETKEELDQKVNEFIQNFKNEAWLNEHIYPYL